MSAHSQAQPHGHGGHGHGHEQRYVKIWGILLALLVVSVVGPMLGNPWITLITAFGIAEVKAYMVAKNFMHINVEKPIIHFMMITGVALMVLLYGAIAPDIQKGEGQNWKKDEGFHHSFVQSDAGHGGGHGAAPAEGHEPAPAGEHGTTAEPAPATGESSGASGH